MSYEYCIVGAGITGLGLLLLLQEAGKDLSSVAIVDPYFDGGDLARKWGSVISNTPWSKTANAVAAAAPSHPLSRTHPAEQTTPLIELAHLLREMATPALRQARAFHGVATRTEWISASRMWTITAVVAGKETSIKSKRLLLCQGSEPRSLGLPIPSIPLEVALDSQRLRHYVTPGQHVLVVGTMHSGTLVLRNVARDCSGVATGLYNTPTPFTWDRDGAYDGLKAEAAEIADSIVRGDAGPITLVQSADLAEVIRVSRSADWVVYAMGFQSRNTVRLFADGEERNLSSYDGATGALTDVPAAWGFGVAYPNRAPDGHHWDVSVAAFLAHMRNQLPMLLLPL